ncbi:STAS/SEC14 domain-containing protein [Arthrobacter sp. ISL-85]|uniref:DUF7793 family protein n=1 Tax=Arthrobacter sp. ISL-85 TaxID=2819115 RepID=UPI001BE961BF|nr:STAS/SEC14 domain-containing protein [Arthrobacter sp. ISL-85]MBT2566291.1 STAS/SEC14 domain-containing protein [Arthrobacter sp. ISL-85]
MRDSVLWIHWLHGTSVTDKDAAALVEQASAVSAGVCPPMLVELNSMASITRAALLRFAKTLDIAAMAIVGPSPVDKALANHFAEVHDPPYPTRYFTANDEALRWLTEHPHAP